METPRDDKLAADLRALRPTPRPEFTAELDERAAAGFPRRSRLGAPASFFDGLLARLRALPPRRLLLPAGGVAVLAIAIATAVVTLSESDRENPRTLLSLAEPKPQHERVAKEPELATEDAPRSASSAGSGTAEEAGEASSGVQYEAAVPTDSYTPGRTQIQPFDRRLRNRAVERSAELVLAADPADVADDAAEVFEAVHAHDGIVMSSSTREGKSGEAGARFELLIPSNKLSDALAALSAIDEVRSRHEATADITAPTVNVAELLQDSKARIDSLLAQLEEAETESEREAVEAELRQERRHRARLRAQLQHLQRRADFSRVLVRIETGAAESSSSDGGWDVIDALGDARRILSIASAVTVVGAAVLGPLVLIALLVWLSYRTRVRRARRRALD